MILFCAVSFFLEPGVSAAYIAASKTDVLCFWRPHVSSACQFCQARPVCAGFSMVGAGGFLLLYRSIRDLSSAKSACCRQLWRASYGFCCWVVARMVHCFAGSDVVSAGGSFLPFYMASIPSADSPSPKWALILINLLVLWNAICGCMVGF